MKLHPRFLTFAVCALAPLCAFSEESAGQYQLNKPAAKPVEKPAEKSAALENGLVRVEVNLVAGAYSIVDAKTGETVLAEAGFGVTPFPGNRLKVEAREDVTDELGKGTR